jgi:predicted PurR-regulated permease PerM
MLLLVLMLVVLVLVLVLVAPITVGGNTLIDDGNPHINKILTTLFYRCSITTSPERTITGVARFVIYGCFKSVSGK